MSPFGEANPPTVPDFEAETIVDVSDVPGLMNVGWGAGKKDAFNGITGSELSLHLGDTGFFHRINRVGVITDLDSLSATTPPGNCSLGKQHGPVPHRPGWCLPALHLIHKL